MDIFEKDFKDNMSFDAALKLALSALASAIEEKLNPESIEIGVVKTDEKFRRLTGDEKAKAIAKAEEKEKKAKAAAKTEE